MFPISAATGEGVEALVHAIHAAVLQAKAEEQRLLAETEAVLLQSEAEAEVAQVEEPSVEPPPTSGPTGAMGRNVES